MKLAISSTKNSQKDSRDSSPAMHAQNGWYFIRNIATSFVTSHPERAKRPKDLLNMLNYWDSSSKTPLVILT